MLNKIYGILPPDIRVADNVFMPSGCKVRRALITLPGALDFCFGEIGGAWDEPFVIDELDWVYIDGQFRERALDGGYSFYDYIADKEKIGTLQFIDADGEVHNYSGLGPDPNALERINVSGAAADSHTDSSRIAGLSYGVEFYSPGADLNIGDNIRIEGQGERDGTYVVRSMEGDGHIYADRPAHPNAVIFSDGEGDTDLNLEDFFDEYESDEPARPDDELTMLYCGAGDLFLTPNILDLLNRVHLRERFGFLENYNVSREDILETSRVIDRRAGLIQLNVSQLRRVMEQRAEDTAQREALWGRRAGMQPLGNIVGSIMETIAQRMAHDLDEMLINGSGENNSGGLADLLVTTPTTNPADVLNAVAPGVLDIDALNRARDYMNEVVPVPPQHFNCRNLIMPLERITMEPEELPPPRLIHRYAFPYTVRPCPPAIRFDFETGERNENESQNTRTDDTAESAGTGTQSFPVRPAD